MPPFIKFLRLLPVPPFFHTPIRWRYSPFPLTLHPFLRIPACCSSWITHRTFLLWWYFLGATDSMPPGTFSSIFRPFPQMISLSHWGFPFPNCTGNPYGWLTPPKLFALPPVVCRIVFLYPIRASPWSVSFPFAVFRPFLFASFPRMLWLPLFHRLLGPSPFLHWYMQ